MISSETPVQLLFLLIFILHECEAIFTFRRWIRRNGADLSHRFPFTQRFVLHAKKLSTTGFALIAAEEFFLLVGATLVSNQWDVAAVWLSLFLAFSFHLVVHVVQCLTVRRYIPGIVSALIAIPFCTIVITRTTDVYSTGTILLYTAAGSVVAGTNLILLHRCVTKRATVHDNRSDTQQ